jgi:hypothetical protein
MAKQSLIIILLLAFSVMSQDSSSIKSNFISLDPLSLCLGSIVINYEHVFAARHGVLLEGDYSLPIISKAYGGMLGYRYHFSSSSKGHFIGPFVAYHYSRSKMQDEYKHDFYYTLKYSALGFDWGYRWQFFKIMNATIRLGLDYPFMDLKWDEAPPESFHGLQTSLVTSIIKAACYVDGELTIAVSF